MSTLAAIPRKDGQVCLAKMNASGSAALSCTTPTVGNPALINYGTAVGLVPDVVSAVTFHLTTGGTVTGATHDNLYDAPPEADSVTFVVDGGAQTIELMPLSALPKGATMVADGTVEVRAQP